MLTYADPRKKERPVARAERPAGIAAACSPIRQHTSAYVSIRQHTSAERPAGIAAAYTSSSSPHTLVA
jgi:hypothetical protein